jgi:hypothetical protein
MLVLTGPLVGVSFINAVRTYAEASGLGGTSTGVGQAFSPLVGVWSPTFGAYEIVSVFLLPFVAIRMVAGDRQSGALKLEQQQSIPSLARLMTKALVLFAGWLALFLAGILAAILWVSYGGYFFAPEVLTVVLGHFLNAALTIAFAAAAASLVEHPSTAAILTFAFTVGTWVIDFVAAVHGGIWEQVAGYTPTALVAQFQHGLIRLDVVLIAAALIGCGLGLASVWIHLGRAFRQRVLQSTVIVGLATAVIIAATQINASWDLSENRQNSFSKADEAMLKQIKAPLRIEAHLAPEDPRRADLERRSLSKLRRVLNNMQVLYISSTSIGLFEQSAEHYGEIWYELDSNKIMSRGTTEEDVLESIFTVAKLKLDENDEAVFLGHPLAVPPKYAAVIFYGIWPAAMTGAALLFFRRNR